MTSQKIAIGLVAVALFVGSMTAHAADFGAGVKAYESGDYATALRIFRQLADQGDASAQTGLGVMYDKGLGVTQDYAAAVRWYRKAAGQGDAVAQFNLGQMYSKGEGVPQDYTEAVRWYRKAADQGDAVAQFNLGQMYSKGEGVAQTNLGNMYVLGWGVTQDYVQAHMWYNLAAARGMKIAGKVRDLLAEQMTPEQIAKAQKLARKWKPKGK
jgi:TPR repeat protein